MRLLQLTYGELSVQEVITTARTEKKILRDWSKKYGQLFKRCKVLLISNETILDTSKDIENLDTGETYKSRQEASEKTGLSIYQVDCQLNKRYKQGFDYILKFEV